MTYGDGLANVDLNNLVNFHNKHNDSYVNWAPNLDLDQLILLKYDYWGFKEKPI